jgi:hypothetical protein
MNPLDRKPFKNDFAGKNAKTKQRFKPNSNLSGYGKGTDVTSKNKLSLPVTRTGSSTGKLVKRTYTDVASGLQGGLRETTKTLEEIKEFVSNPYNDPFQKVISRIRFWRKNSNKAEVALAQEELRRLATRHNRMKDPEVLDALSESEEDPFQTGAWVPYVHVDYNTCPITVAWVRVTSSGRETKDWHIVTIKRYKQDKLVRSPEIGREYVPTRFHGIRTRKDAIEVALKEDPPRKLKASEGKWSEPVVREFVQKEAKNFPSSFIATNSGAL